MLPALMLAAVLSGASPDPLDSAIERYRSVESYRVTLHSLHADGEEHIRYYYRKPGFVRMEFIRPHEGAVLVYSPLTKRARLWPFGISHFPELDLSPGNLLIQSPRGQHVDRSDVGTLYENVRMLRANGDTEVVGEENVGAHAARHLAVTGAGDSAVAGVHRYELWLDIESQFPVKVVSRDRKNDIIETVTMEALEINVVLPESLFNP